MKKVRIGVIGIGWIGYRHAQLAMSSEQLDLVAVCDPAPNAEALAKQLGKTLYRDHRNMMEVETLDGVVVATPTGLHADVAIACAERGLHLLVEKPIADTLENAQRLIDAAEKNKVHLLVGHYRRFHPPVETAREIVESGRIGSLIGVSGIWAVFKDADYFKPEWRRRLGAGPILTNLIHDIDCLRYICGEIESVRSITSSAGRGFQVEDTAGVLLHFECGAIGTILVSDVTPSPWGFEAATGDNPDLFKTGENCYYFLGSKGSFSFSDLKVWHYPEPMKSGWRHPIEANTILENKAAPGLEPLAAQLEHFGRVIRGEESPRISGRDGLQTFVITRSVLQAGVLRDGCASKIPRGW